jgi:hypothetical protein
MSGRALGEGIRLLTRVASSKGGSAGLTRTLSRSGSRGALKATKSVKPPKAMAPSQGTSRPRSGSHHKSSSHHDSGHGDPGRGDPGHGDSGGGKRRNSHSKSRKHHDGGYDEAPSKSSKSGSSSSSQHYNDGYDRGPSKSSKSRSSDSSRQSHLNYDGESGSGSTGGEGLYKNSSKKSSLKVITSKMPSMYQAQEGMRMASDFAYTGPQLINLGHDVKDMFGGKKNSGGNGGGYDDDDGDYTPSPGGGPAGGRGGSRRRNDDYTPSPDGSDYTPSPGGGPVGGRGGGRRRNDDYTPSPDGSDYTPSPDGRRGGPPRGWRRNDDYTPSPDGSDYSPSPGEARGGPPRHGRRNDDYTPSPDGSDYTPSPGGGRGGPPRGWRRNDDYTPSPDGSDYTPSPGGGRRGPPQHGRRNDNYTPSPDGSDYTPSPGSGNYSSSSDNFTPSPRGPKRFDKWPSIKPAPTSLNARGSSAASHHGPSPLGPGAGKTGPMNPQDVKPTDPFPFEKCPHIMQFKNGPLDAGPYNWAAGAVWPAHLKKNNQIAAFGGTCDTCDKAARTEVETIQLNPSRKQYKRAISDYTRQRGHEPSIDAQDQIQKTFDTIERREAVRAVWTDWDRRWWNSEYGITNGIGKDGRMQFKKREIAKRV